jgi:YVTN family beta-propeller protein
MAVESEARPFRRLQFAYVTNYGSSTVSVIAASSNTVVATVPGVKQATGVAVTPDGAFAYVTTASFGTVSVVDTASNIVVTTIPTSDPYHPTGVAVTPDGAHVYVTNPGFGLPISAGSVSVIATASNAVTATFPAGKGPTAVAITPNGAHAYVANYYDGTVSVIDAARKGIPGGGRKVATTIPVGSIEGPQGVAITPDGDVAYVTNGADAAVYLIDTIRNKVMGKIPLEANTGPGGLAITPDGSYVYVTALNGTVSVIATARNAVIATIPVGPFPNAVAISPYGNLAYVTNNQDGTVSVIDTASNTVVATISVGVSPQGVAIALARLP